MLRPVPQPIEQIGAIHLDGPFFAAKQSPFPAAANTNASVSLATRLKRQNMDSFLDHVRAIINILLAAMTELWALIFSSWRKCLKVEFRQFHSSQIR